MDKFEDFANKSGLNSEQKQAVAEYLREMIKENLLLMKEEYNSEIDAVIESLDN